MRFKIIASLTTIPSRIDLIHDTIQSVINQTVPIHSVEINIPHKFKRKNEDYIIPGWLTDLEKSTKNTKCPVKLFRTRDFGPATKVVPTFLRHRNDKDKETTYVWSVDDDFAYPVNMLATLFREFNPNKKTILSHSCANWKIDLDSGECVGHLAGRAECKPQFVEGFASVLYPITFIGDDFEDYMLKVIENPFCKNGDDVIISNYFNMKGAPFHNCMHPQRAEFFNVVTKGGLKYGRTSDALHLQPIGNQPRYIKIYNWLAENNLNSWIK